MEEVKEEADADNRADTKGWLQSLIRKGDAPGEPAINLKAKAEGWLQSWRGGPVDSEGEPSDEPAPDSLDDAAETAAGDVKGWLQSWGWKRPANAAEGTPRSCDITADVLNEAGLVSATGDPVGIGVSNQAMSSAEGGDNMDDMMPWNP